jgi:hypothetical protein
VFGPTVRAVRVGRLLRRLHNKPQVLPHIAHGFMPPKAAAAVASSDTLPPPPGSTETDLQWIWLDDNGPNVRIDGSFEVALAFASQVKRERGNFMVDWHNTDAVEVAAKARSEGVPPMLWKISKDIKRVYEPHSDSSADGKSCVHVLVVDKRDSTKDYYPMIPRIWMADIAKGLCAVNEDDVIISHNGRSVIASSFDSESGQWNSSVRAPSVALKRRTPLPQQT